MSILSWLKKPEPTLDDHTRGMASLLTLVSVEETKNLMKAWKVNFDDRTQVLLFLEYIMILVAMTDRLALKKFGDPARSQYMNAMLNRIRGSFLAQTSVGKTKEERIQFFESLLSDRITSYAKCLSIMGDELSLVFIGSIHLVETFHKGKDKAELDAKLEETWKVLGKTVVALMAVPDVKRLMAA